MDHGIGPPDMASALSWIIFVDDERKQIKEASGPQMCADPLEPFTRQQTFSTARS